MRGTRLPSSLPQIERRFIPARAGNTTQPGSGPSRSSVHPRACGEHECGENEAKMRIGSSPRVRGTRPAKVQGTGQNGSSPRVRGTLRGPIRTWTSARFIPARAGNTVGDPAAAHEPSVHPLRVRGTQDGGGSDLKPIGSSPRVRGTRRRRQSGRPLPRFIPARAGNTCAANGRGGNHRFIPARAGNTRGSELERIRFTVHPRACGEHDSCIVGPTQRFGSSPRVRGTRDYRLET